MRLDWRRDPAASSPEQEGFSADDADEEFQDAYLCSARDMTSLNSPGAADKMASA
jgi:hypothetical protein